MKGTTAYSLVRWYGGCEEERNLRRSETTQLMHT